ncbi:hypothetical protein O3M35_009385 [Rhynocoris fuscipes]|uniref:GH18 domain-containing protein n=1 Tax=Rhynocoris fuscipes TaxID=488301 RepID=A0AAW1D403_9HEMI
MLKEHSFDQNKYKKLNVNKTRYLPWFIALFGIVLLVLICQVLRLNWRILDALQYEEFNLNLKFKNYEELHKLYKNSTSENIIKESNNGFIAGAPNSTVNSFRVVCYYVVSFNLTRFRQLATSSVDPYLCTHIIVGFAIVENGTLQPKNSSDTLEYRNIINLKLINPSLKVLLSVQDFSSKGEFAQVVSSEELRKKFALNALNFINTTGFDGLDLDWEFPAWPDADLTQARNFTLLLGEFRHLINSSKDKNFRKLELSVAVASPLLIMSQSYEIEAMAGLVDFVNLMSYDFHLYTTVSPVTGANAPLYQRKSESGIFSTLNTNWSAMHWVLWGMPWFKINVGIPTYGHSFRLINSDNNGWNAPSSGFGRTGDGKGFITYSDACRLLNDTSTTHVFDDEYDVPYAYNGDEWISYDNALSVTLKAFYIKNSKFGGAMIFCLNSDDFDGICSPVKFPLTRTISNILIG